MAREDLLANLLQQLMQKEDPPAPDDNILIQKMITPNDNIASDDVMTISKQSASNMVWGGTIFNNGTFSRNSIAYNPDDSQVSANTPRFQTGKFGNGVMIEEGTTNLFSNPANFSVSAWVKGGGTVVQTDGQTITFTGQTDLYHAVGALSASTIYTMSWKLKGSYNGQKIRLSYETDTIGAIGTGYDVIILTTSEQIFTKTITTGTGGTYNRFMLYQFTGDNANNVSTLIATFAQVEQKPYATSFVDGTRSPESLTIPSTGVLNTQQGTLEFDVYINDTTKITTRYYPTIFSIWGKNGSSEGWFGLDHAQNTSQWRMACDNIAGSPQTYLIPDSYTPNGWHSFAIIWNKNDSNRLNVFIDGVIVLNAINVNLLEDFAPNFYIGLCPDGTRQLDTLFDDFRISSIARSDADILAGYNSNLPLPVDQYTTCKLNADNNLNNSAILNSNWLWNQGQYSYGNAQANLNIAEILQQNDIITILKHTPKSSFVWGGTGITTNWNWNQGQWQ